MLQFSEMTYSEQREIAELFSTWLEGYTDEVIKKVTCRVDEIINNEMAMKMIRELKRRKDAEKKDFTNSICCLLGDYETYKEYDPHLHILTHSKSYADVLADMYIY